MNTILTLAATTAGELDEGRVTAVRDFLGQFSIESDTALTWLSEARAAEFEVSTVPDQENMQALHLMLKACGTDVFVTAGECRRKKLMLADMDSTIVTSETLDDIAVKAGVGEKVVEITRRSMNGELDFEMALNERMALLEDAPVSLLEEVYAETYLMSSATSFVRTMVKSGAVCVLVTGGFTWFAEKIAEAAGFHYFHGNVLDFKGAYLSGKVLPPVLDKSAKLAFLEQYRADKGLEHHETLAIGDGANDLSMLKEAGLGIGYHPKKLVKDTMLNCILHGDLRHALYAQGYNDDEIVTL